MNKEGSAVLNGGRMKVKFDAEKYRKDFPVLQEKMRGSLLVYLDNAATTQKPQAVIDTVTRYYSKENANIHRGIYHLSEQATDAYEIARAKMRRFINATFPQEIIFVRGATEGINLIAQSFGRAFMKEGDEIVISAIEHHSNIVPWQILCGQIKAKLRVIPVNDDGELLFDEYKKLLNHRTKLVALAHISNALGTINPVKTMVKTAHTCGVPVLVDGAQGVPHVPTDVQDLDCDFYVFSGHKLFGPTGIGVLYGRRDWLERMPPYQGGGDMISSVTFEKTTYNRIPYKFEAGTPHIAGVIGLGTAVDYLEKIGMENIAAYETELLQYGTEGLLQVPGLRLIGTAKEKAGVLSFVLDEIHAHDIGTILDRNGVAIRAGHHCAMPVMERFGVPATARASLAFYNTRRDIDALVRALHEARKVFKL